MRVAINNRPVKAIALAAGLGLVVAISVSAVTSANIGKRPQVAAAPAPPETLDTTDDPAPLTHAERMALFARRLAEFRLLHRPPAVARLHAAYSPIKRGGTDLECLTQAVYYEARGRRSPARSPSPRWW